MAHCGIGQRTDESVDSILLKMAWFSATCIYSIRLRAPMRGAAKNPHPERKYLLTLAPSDARYNDMRPGGPAETKRRTKMSGRIKKPSRSIRMRGGAWSFVDQTWYPARGSRYGYGPERYPGDRGYGPCRVYRGC
jgi:hypothetical protein